MKKQNNEKQNKAPFTNNKARGKFINKKNKKKVPAKATNSSAEVGVASSSHAASLAYSNVLDAVKNQKSKFLKKENGRDSIPGFIFICNGITKPECYKYRVFGLSAGKMDVLQKIKPGATLFLFDVDKKLLYGLYKAASAGEMNLEPHAFDGKFPAQVRFEISRDCFPLPESSFKSAIRANYNGQKFSQELSNRQIKALRFLFRPFKPPSDETPVPLFVPTAVVEHHPPPTRVPHLVRDPYLPPPARYLPSPELVPRTYDLYREPVRASHLQAVVDPQQPVANRTLYQPLYASYHSTKAHAPYYQRETHVPYHQPETNPTYYQPGTAQPYDPEMPVYRAQNPYARSASVTCAYGPSYQSLSHQLRAGESTFVLETSADYYNQLHSTIHSTAVRPQSSSYLPFQQPQPATQSTSVQTQSYGAASYAPSQLLQPTTHSTSVQTQTFGAASYVPSQQPHTLGELPSTHQLSYYGAPPAYEVRTAPTLSAADVPVSSRYGFSRATTTYW
ncbi:DCD domain-containing protein [Drosera capensis]